MMLYAVMQGKMCIRDRCRGRGGRHRGQRRRSAIGPLGFVDGLGSVGGPADGSCRAGVLQKKCTADKPCPSGASRTGRRHGQHTARKHSPAQGRSGPTAQLSHGTDVYKRQIMDPGMAFGTGTHETTSLCLETLDSLVKGGERVLDIGCLLYTSFPDGQRHSRLRQADALPRRMGRPLAGSQI